MLNKRRQELIIQNLKSISSQVRLMSIEQLVNLPGMPIEEKVKHIENCLNDSEEAIQSAAKLAIAKLSGNTVATPEVSATPTIPSTPSISSTPATLATPTIQSNPTIPSAPITPTTPIASTISTTPIVQNIPNISVPQTSDVALIDGPVDPSLPPINRQTDIAFLIQHIQTIAAQKPAGYLTRIFELAQSVHEEVALTALQILFNLKDSRVAPHILELLNDSHYSSQRRFLMLKIVMDTNEPLSSKILENILVNEKDVIVKSGLVKVFARNCKEEGIPLLIKCLKDEDPRVRANTVEVIESQRIKGCEQEVIKLLNDSENRVKVNAAKYLVKIGYQQAFLTLKSMLVSPEVWLRDSVIFALGEIADQASLVLLRAALKDPNQGIRLSVLKALARINSNIARQILKAVTGDPDPVVAQVAMSLYNKIKDTPETAMAVLPQRPQFTMQMQPGVVQQRPTVVPSQTTGLLSLNQPTPVTQKPVAPVLPSLNQVAPVNPTNLAAPVLPSLNQVAAVNPTNPVVAPKTPVQGTVVLPSLNQITPSAQVPPQRPFNTVGSSPVVPPLAGISKPAPVMAKPVTGNPSVTTTAANGTPAFAKPRSAEIYTKLCSSSVDDQRAGARDIVFVMGDDQMILLRKAITIQDENVRLAAVKLISRKRTPEAREMLSKLSNDPNETISSLAQKALVMLK